MRFEHLEIPHQYRHYWTKYPEGYTILEALFSWIKQVNDLVDLTNQNIDYMEQFTSSFDKELSDEVQRTLKDWQESGFLNVVVNEAIEIETNRRLDLFENTFGLNVLNPPNGLEPATGDGVADDTQTLQAMLDYLHENGGGRLFVPKGTYKITSPLSLYSDITIEGTGSHSRFIKDNGNYFFRADGTIGTENKLSQDKTTGDRTIKTINSHGLTVGDLILIKSQRNSLHSDSGDWQLGYSTSGTNCAYFGEFLIVQSVAGTNEFITSSGLLYPYYYKDNSRETDINSRQAATIQKIEPAKNIKIKNIGCYGKVAGILSTQYAYNVETSGLDCFIKESGCFVAFRESFECRDKGSRVTYDPSFTPEFYYQRNALKVISSQNCGYDGTIVEHGTQSFDSTFNDYSICSTYPYLKNAHILFSTTNPGTTHGGVYAPLITGNTFTGCLKNGFSTRSRKSIITDNIIELNDNSITETYGVAIYEGCAVDCIISNNQISGFHRGIDIIDGTERYFGWIGALIDGNVITRVNRGIMFSIDEANPNGVYRGVVVTNNIIKDFTGTYAKGMMIQRGHGTKAMNNVFNDPAKATNCGIYIVDSTDCQIGQNDFRNIDGKHVWCAETTLPSPNVHVYAGGSLTPAKIDLSNYLSARHTVGSEYPVGDDLYSKGWSGARFKAFYASNGSILTSDRNHKEFIGEIPESWLAAWAEVSPKVYKMKSAIKEKGEAARWHIGVIAQDIIESFEKQGVNALEIGLVTYDKWIDVDGQEKEMYGVRPDECLFLEMAYLRSMRV